MCNACIKFSYNYSISIIFSYSLIYFYGNMQFKLFVPCMWIHYQVNDWHSLAVTTSDAAYLGEFGDRVRPTSVKSLKFSLQSLATVPCSSLCSKIQSKLSSPAGPVSPGSRAAEPGVQVSKTSILANSLSVSPTLTRHFDSDVECDVM